MEMGDEGVKENGERGHMGGKKVGDRWVRDGILWDGRWERILPLSTRSYINCNINTTHVYLHL